MKEKKEQSASKPHNTIQSVDRALSILELFTSQKTEWGVSEIARALSLNKSTAFGLITTLEYRKYLEKKDDGAKYRLGLRVLDLSSVRLSGFEFIDSAHPVLKDVMTKVGETVHLAIYDNGEVIYVDKIEASNTLKISSFIGKRNPCYCTGVGKCLLAFQKEVEIDRVLQFEMIPYTQKTVTNSQGLKSLLAQIRKEKIAFDDEEFENGLVCIAVPIFDRFNEVCAAISISSPTIRTDKRRIEEFAGVLKKAGMAISFSIGYRGK